jgi:hypothetical protein
VPFANVINTNNCRSCIPSAYLNPRRLSFSSPVARRLQSLVISPSGPVGSSGHIRHCLAATSAASTAASRRSTRLPAEEMP